MVCGRFLNPKHVYGDLTSFTCKTSYYSIFHISSPLNFNFSETGILNTNSDSVIFSFLLVSLRRLSLYFLSSEIIYATILTKNKAQQFISIKNTLTIFDKLIFLCRLFTENSCFLYSSVFYT